MERTRDWRIKMELKKTIKRLKLKSYKYYSIYDVNNRVRKYSKIMISDFIGTKDYFLSKTISTSSYDTKNKSKYSPNRRKVSPWRRYNDERSIREKNKIELIKILKYQTDGNGTINTKY